MLAVFIPIVNSRSHLPTSCGLFFQPDTCPEERKIRSCLFPRTEAEIDALLQTWKLKAEDHKTTYGLTAAQLAQISDDSIVYTHSRLARQVFDDEDAELSAWKKNAFTGDPKGTAAPFPSVTIPPLPATANPPKQGIVPRNTELYNYFKNHPNRTAESLADLGITETAAAPISPDDLKPQCAAKALADDKVELSFKKQGQQAVRWQMRRGGGDFGSDKDGTTSPLIDETPSTGGNPEKREYRAIYLKNNKPIGQYSDIMTVFTMP
jgi:hypothetical protein